MAEKCHAAHKESGLAQGGKFATVQLDVSDKTQVAAFWDRVPSDLRDVDILGTILSNPDTEQMNVLSPPPPHSSQQRWLCAGHGTYR